LKILKLKIISMFDNLTPQQNNQPTPAVSNISPNTVPIPQREPEDIFSGADAAAGREKTQAPLKPAQFQPRQNVRPASEITAAQNEPAGIQEAAQKSSGKKYVIIALAVIVALVIILIGMIVLAYYKAGSLSAPATAPATVNEEQQPSTVSSDQSAGPSADLPAENNNAADVTANQESNEKSGAVILDEITDTDGDGLTDGEEKRLGTDVNKVDSDSDGLFDREETRIYKTDPLNADTDGDGYSDGDEVKNGYNPNGAGKLYELPK